MWTPGFALLYCTTSCPAGGMAGLFLFKDTNLLLQEFEPARGRSGKAIRRCVWAEPASVWLQ